MPTITFVRNCSLLAILTLMLALGAQAQTAPTYKDPTQPIDARLHDLLQRMTLEEKVAQLKTFYADDPSVLDEQGDFVGGNQSDILSNGAGELQVTARIPNGPQPLDRFLSDPKAAIRRFNSIQKFMREKTRLGIPVFNFGEALHGCMATGATIFPQSIALGSTWDVDLVERVFTVAALETRARGIHQVYAPVIDLAREPRWGRFEECYGEDPYLVSRIGAAAIFGYQGRSATIDKRHVAVTLKHFAGHGQPEGGRNIAPVNYSEREFRSNHLYPFEYAVKVAGARSIMASYNEWDGVPNHMNRHLLTDILRDEWGFNGYALADGSGLEVAFENHHAAPSYTDVGALSVEAGLDYELGGKGRCFSQLVDAVKSGKVKQSSIDRAVSGVLRMKLLLGLFEAPYTDIDEVAKVTNTPEHRALARQAATEAMILLKNSNRLLPLDASKIKTLAVIGPNAAEIHLGGYSPVPMQGVDVLQGIRDFAGASMNVLYAEGCKITTNRVAGWIAAENPIPNTPEDDARLIGEAVATALKSDAVILALGENELLRREAWSDDHLGDRDSLTLSGRQMELARAVLATGKPVVVLLINGGPLLIEELQEKAPAIIECWYLGQETGGAVADVLFGKVSPSGRLTVTIPRSIGQLPCYYNHKPSRFRDYVQADNRPLYPFGFGLSYTEFEFKDIQVTPATIAPGGTAKVSVQITNTGTMKADEVVQLYIHAVTALPTRPVKELKDFARIGLAPGETRTVTFELTPDKLEAIDLDMKRRVQPGDFEIMVGKSSVDLLKASLRVE